MPAIRSNSKLSIVGAGSVGSSLAYASLIRGSAREVVLYDIDRARVEAEVLDLAHGTQFTGSSEIHGGHRIEACADSDIVIITAGAKQRPGQTRLDLAATNVRILEDLMPKLVEVSPDAVYVLVTNPCDVLTVVAQRISGLPRERVISTGTLLDTSRLRWLLAKMAGGLSPSSVHAMIVGEHGDSEFALWSQATIGPMPIMEWERDGELPFNEATLDQVATEVREAAYHVIAGKGATNYAIGLSGARLVEAMLSDERAIVPVSSVLDGYRGLSGVALSVPTLVGAGGVRQLLDVPMSRLEQRRLDRSAEAIAQSLASLGLER